MSVKSEVAVRCEDERGARGPIATPIFHGGRTSDGRCFCRQHPRRVFSHEECANGGQRYAQSYRPCDSYVRNMFGMQNMRDCLFVDPRGRDKSRACQKLCF